MIMPKQSAKYQRVRDGTIYRKQAVIMLERNMKENFRHP